MIDLKYKNVLVTGCSGLLGRPLVDKLIERGASVYGVGYEKQPVDWPQKAVYGQIDMSDGCENMLQDIEYVFHLAGAKGGVGIGQTKAADFMRGNILSTANLFSEIVSELDQETHVQRVLFTSSVGAYPGNQEVFYEYEDIWSGPPHPSDFFGGMAKRVGEALCEAHRKQYGLDYVIVRPTNCYGPYDRFDPETGMVIAALIARIEAGERPLKVWGDGTARRDFLYSKDCAEGMILAMERGESGEAYNLGTGLAVDLRQVVSLITGRCDHACEVEFDASKPSGPYRRQMDMQKSFRAFGNFLKYDNVSGMANALDETVEWYRANKDYQKYDPFKKQ